MFNNDEDDLYSRDAAPPPPKQEPLPVELPADEYVIQHRLPWVDWSIFLYIYKYNNNNVKLSLHRSYLENSTCLREVFFHRCRKPMSKPIYNLWFRIQIFNSVKPATLFWRMLRNNISRFSIFQNYLHGLINFFNLQPLPRQTQTCGYSIAISIVKFGAVFRTSDHLFLCRTLQWTRSQ